MLDNFESLLFEQIQQQYYMYSNSMSGNLSQIAVYFRHRLELGSAFCDYTEYIYNILVCIPEQPQENGIRCPVLCSMPCLVNQWMRYSNRKEPNDLLNQTSMRWYGIRIMHSIRLDLLTMHRLSTSIRISLICNMHMHRSSIGFVLH